MDAISVPVGTGFSCFSGALDDPQTTLASSGAQQPETQVLIGQQGDCKKPGVTVQLNVNLNRHKSCKPGRLQEESRRSTVYKKQMEPRHETRRARSHTCTGTRGRGSRGKSETSVNNQSKGHQEKVQMTKTFEMRA